MIPSNASFATALKDRTQPFQALPELSDPSLDQETAMKRYTDQISNSATYSTPKPLEPVLKASMNELAVLETLMEHFLTEDMSRTNQILARAIGHYTYSMSSRIRNIPSQLHEGVFDWSHELNWLPPVKFPSDGYRRGMYSPQSSEAKLSVLKFGKLILNKHLAGQLKTLEYEMTAIAERMTKLREAYLACSSPIIPTSTIKEFLDGRRYTPKNLQDIDWETLDSDELRFVHVQWNLYKPWDEMTLAELNRRINEIEARALHRVNGEGGEDETVQDENGLESDSMTT
ncbi:hypothetical protein TREMEDRAFT_66343 [Tremella mesenterica DSM 1558]|uniref:uncharacterized protein n=1 Tax=Tremella mesenterica (strain ATCC 24925 / CBS 8224 / DSM 1558 / NBRC 9311 / NRRL Y-6157 / RJB 2259-6 / UBC 559-6) TaxID=578456 RepID=UPI00032D3F84|nr:uncharacterized protein TREMEDRAFT_66343 [Tremella mesenterica DSM 1558]EIW65618.1 hypothetical protein TREMEDRAFT_66343 [Tremella mesenterica DSM 1558]